MATSNKVAMVLEAIAELFPMHRTKQVTRQDLKAVTAHYAVELDDRWLDVLLREHVVALHRHIERKKTQNDATIKELVYVMIDDIEEAMRLARYGGEQGRGWVVLKGAVLLPPGRRRA
jgi:hypothetical protein